MLRAAAPLALAGLLAVAGCGKGGPASATPTPAPTVLLSGVDVLTISGPTCPVQRQGDTCTAPIAAAVVVTRSDGSVAARATTSSNGRGHIPLPPGSYTVSGESGGHAFPRPPAPQPVTVPPDQFVAVQLSFDTGIR
ncbi:MAG TPA: carboxypeptidase-like regulatory domain-containing protein [Candidatus Angelobacter sp.]|jgi:hypothetical protein|nr:carboxypeptidase-like regulatory domain-containing protein [Candidatus Angelobacter sp.]